jgi:hypothetical protein
VKANVIEEQVKIEALAPDLERDLAADEGKAAAEFQKQIAELCRISPLRPFIVCRALGIERLHVNGDFECMSSTA